MAKCIDMKAGFTLRDLTLEDGVVFEIGDEYKDMLDEEEFSYSSDKTFGNEEAFNLLNMENIQDEKDEKDEKDVKDENDKNISMTICGMGFSKLKSAMTDLLGNGKVMKLIKQKGVGEVIPHDAQVTVKYMGYVEFTDEPFDSSYAHERSDTFRLDQGMLIPGLEIAITSMKKHEVAMFIIHPDFAYGKFGCPPRIPPNEEVLFIVHLIDYIDNGCITAYEFLSPEEKKQFPIVVNWVHAKFNTAKDFFNKKQIKQAIREYTRAVKRLEETELRNEDDEEVAKKLLTRGYNNIATCCNIENKSRQACNACNRVPTPTVKTYFNHGRALLRMGEYSSAMEKLQIALQRDPQNEEVIKEIRETNEKQRKYMEAEKRLWKSCLNIKNKTEEESEFKKAARELCQTFFEDNQIFRQPLPKCLTAEEEKYIREQAAAFGLTVTTHERYGTQITYLNKPNF